MTAPDLVREADPEDIFALLSNDTRIAILRALWEIDGNEATFSELRETVGARDSGRFNYHLGELVDRFVARTDDGYALTHQGRLINGAIATGAYTMSGAIEPIVLEEPCAACGGVLSMEYDGEQVTVECDSCPSRSGFVLPPGVLAGTDREEIPRIASRYLRTTFEAIDNGFCHYCEGRTRSEVVPLAELAPSAPEDAGDASEDAGDASEDAGDASDRLGVDVETIPWVRYECDRCGAAPTAGLDLVCLDHPAVAGFYYENGIDVTRRTVWELGVGDPTRAEIVGREPFRARVSFRTEDDELTLIVDDERTVVDVER